MRYTNNGIYTAIRTAVLDSLSTANVTQTYAPVPTKFPTVFAREIGRLTPNGTPTLTNKQDIYETTWEIHVHSDLNAGAKEQAYQLMGVVKSVMQNLYFIETFETPIDNKGYYTLVTRFRRIIGGGETMPTSGDETPPSSGNQTTQNNS